MSFYEYSGLKDPGLIKIIDLNWMRKPKPGLSHGRNWRKTFLHPRIIRKASSFPLEYSGL